MSFSSKVKEELCEIVDRSRHCKIAELTAIIIFCGRIRITENEGFRLLIHTENNYVTKKFYALIREVFGICPEVSIRKNMRIGSLFYTVALKGETVRAVLELTKLMDKNGEIRGDIALASNLVVQKSCCKRAFVRGAFLSAGSIGDPEKGYHFEITTTEEEKAAELKEILENFQIHSKIVKRKKHYPVYVKEGEQLSELLGLMGAPRSLMRYENIRILKDVRNRVNRTVNCETANLKKTADAAAKQMEDIMIVREEIGLEELPFPIRELAEIRMEYPELSIKELGGLLTKPIGKSGVNHRFNKIAEIAEDLRKKRGKA